MSQRETILASLQSSLSGLASGRVYRAHREQLPDLPAIIITPVSDVGAGALLGVVDRILTVDVAIYARGDIPDQAADSLVDQVLQIVSASNALGLGPDVEIRPDPDIDPNFENYDDIQVVVRLVIDYRT